MKQIKSTSRKAKKVSSKSLKASKVESSLVEKSLEARKADEMDDVKLKGSPINMFALHQELSKNLHSTGGRKSLKGRTRRQKIPLSEEDWEKLKELAKQTENEDLNATPGQIASLILHETLKSL